MSEVGCQENSGSAGKTSCKAIFPLNDNIQLSAYFEMSSWYDITLEHNGFLFVNYLRIVKITRHLNYKNSTILDLDYRLSSTISQIGILYCIPRSVAYKLVINKCQDKTIL